VTAQDAADRLRQVAIGRRPVCRFEAAEVVRALVDYYPNATSGTVSVRGFREWRFALKQQPRSVVHGLLVNLWDGRIRHFVDKSGKLLRPSSSADNKCLIVPMKRKPMGTILAAPAHRTPPDDLPHPAIGEPSGHDLAALFRAYRVACSRGLRIPAGSFEVTWYDADDSSRETLGFVWPGTPINMWIQTNQGGNKAFITCLHELRHVHQLTTGLWWRMTRDEREADAYGFERSASREAA
jgi:hypothetical protein